jgi:hypothetical protein
MREQLWGYLDQYGWILWLALSFWVLWMISGEEERNEIDR